VGGTETLPRVPLRQPRSRRAMRPDLCESGCDRRLLGALSERSEHVRPGMGSAAPRKESPDPGAGGFAP
jgi:hypothetical protein